MTCAISWGRTSLIGLLVVMSFVDALVFLIFSLPLDGVGLRSCACPIVLCSLLLFLFWIGCFLSNSTIM